MKKPLIFLPFVLSAILLSSCGSSHKAIINPNNNNTATSSGFTGNQFVRTYSQKLGIQLNEGMNRALIEKVAEWMGVPYKYGGSSKSGTDCSGFITQIFLAVYQIKLPRTAQQMHQQSKAVKTSALQEGDLVFFKINTRETGHVGIYLLNGWFAHASTSKGVEISKLSDFYWNKYFEEGGRFL